jgi:phenylpropionate dioxygenase-like ring-hydroxylating dioxygenase large terminal subunit
MATLTREPLAAGIGPVLRDGTAVRDLIDLDRREVAMRVLSDPEIYRLELEHIFAKGWSGLAHVNEIPEVGDFVVRYIGEDKVIVTRTPAGDVSVMLNVCAHRGAQLCWAEEGNSKSFKCPYHGWAFDGTGNLLGAPLEKEMYGDWDKSQYGLRRARVEVRSGIIFATFDKSGRTLDQWLGTAAWYINHAGHEDRVPLGPPMRFLVQSNWKTFIDQGSGDNYHVLSLHRALHEIGLLADLPGSGGSRTTLRGWNQVVVSNPEGNTVFGLPGDPLAAPPAEDSESYLSFEDRLFAVTVLPQTVLWSPYVYPSPDGSRLTGSALWQVEPKGPDSFVMVLQNFIDRDVPEPVKDILRHFITTQQGHVEDDFEANLALQRSAGGAVGQQQPMRYFAQGDTTKPDNWPGPGIFFTPPQRDDGQWLFWRRWLDLMTGDAR